jgi:hypothetical protein
MGFGNISEARRVAQSSQANKPRVTPTFVHEIWALIPDEVVVVRFVGGPSEPYIFHQHGFARHPERGFEKGICLRPADCPMCAAASVPGEKRIKRATPYAGFTIYSTRKMLKIPHTKEDGTQYFKREPVRCNLDGQHIKKAPGANQPTTIVAKGVDPRVSQYESEDEGLKVWCGSLHPKANNADKLLALDMRLQKLCQCGETTGEGLSARPAEIILKGHACEECGDSINHYEAGAGNTTCRGCGHVGIPNEIVDCAADCGNPKRGGLIECYVRISRRGAGTDTVYDFNPLPFSRPEHPLECKELKSIYASNLETANEMLSARGIGKSGGALPSSANPDVPW